jgi:hypothetical protein
VLETEVGLLRIFKGGISVTHNYEHLAGPHTLLSIVQKVNQICYSDTGQSDSALDGYTSHLETSREPVNFVGCSEETETS